MTGYATGWTPARGSLNGYRPDFGLCAIRTEFCHREERSLLECDRPMTTLSEKLKIEARARVTWGESSDQIRSFLAENGVSDEEAETCLASLFGERRVQIREDAVRSIGHGGLKLLTPVIAYVTFHSIGFFIPRVFGAAVLVGMWGLYQIIKGVLALIFPHVEAGRDLSENND